MSDLSLPPEAEDAHPDAQNAGSGQTTPQEVKQTLDWRLVAIVGVAVLLLLAVYINKKYYSIDAPSPTSELAEPLPAEQTPDAPAPSPEEQYAGLIHQREMEVAETMFVMDDKAYLVAFPPMPIRSRDDPKRIAGIRPGGLFDVSKCLDGVKPQMLHRRGLPGRREIAFVDIFPPLGLPDGIKGVTKRAEEITLADVSDTEAVIGMAVGGEARAYPIRFANYHEVINDTLGGVPIVVTWSALANAASAMERRLDTGDEIQFGAAWLIYQGAIVLYDIETRSLWSSAQRQCIAGQRMETSLKPLQVVVTSWSAWKKMRPATTVLVGTNPLLRINYEFNPALPSEDYWLTSNVLYPVYGFQVSPSPMRMKSHVFGVTSPDGNGAKAYEANLLRENGTASFEDAIHGQKVLINFDADANVLSATDTEQRPLLVEATIWMCWAGLHPDTEVWQEQRLRQAYNPQTPQSGIEETGPLPESE